LYFERFPEPAEVDESGWGCGWESFFTLSELEDPENRWRSPHETLKLRIRFLQFGGMLGCKEGKEEELVGLKVKTGDEILLNVGTLLESQALSDLQIQTSDGKVFQAHKSILAGSGIAL
jgi:hypothetical protein